MISFIKKRVRNWLGEISSSACRRVIEESSKWSPSLKVQQVQLASYYRELVANGRPLPSLGDVGFRVFSEYEEDGLLLFLFAVLGAKHRTFVDIGSADGINSNCANLAINLGWRGVYIDADANRVEHGRAFYGKHADTWAYPPRFVCAKVNRENINALIGESGFEGEIDLLSIDIDGNDYWIWEALERVRPRVVVIETHVEFGLHNIVVPYDRDFSPPGKNRYYRGASPMATAQLARRLGYRLVGANRLGFNSIFVRNDEGRELLPEVSVESTLWHPRNKAQLAYFEPIKSLPYVEGGSPFPGTPVDVTQGRPLAPREAQRRPLALREEVLEQTNAS